MVKNVLATVLIFVGLATSSARATSTDYEFAKFLQTLANHPGVSFEGDSLVLHEVHGLTKPIVLTGAAALCGAAFYLIKKEKAHRSVYSDYSGPAIVGLICAGAATYSYYKHINPPILCKFTKNGFEANGENLIPWSEIHDCEIRVERTVDQYQRPINESSILSLWGHSGSKLLELEVNVSNMPIKPEELDVLIKKYCDFFGRNPSITTKKTTVQDDDNLDTDDLDTDDLLEEVDPNFKGNWTETFTLTHGEVAEHTPTCVRFKSGGLNLSMGKSLDVDGSTFNGVKIVNLHLKTDSTRDEFTAALKAANLYA